MPLTRTKDGGPPRCLGAGVLLSRNAVVELRTLESVRPMANSFSCSVPLPLAFAIGVRSLDLLESANNLPARGAEIEQGSIRIIVTEVYYLASPGTVYRGVKLPGLVEMRVSVDARHWYCYVGWFRVSSPVKGLEMIALNAY